MKGIKLYEANVHGQHGVVLGAVLGNTVVAFDYSGEAYIPDFNVGDLGYAARKLHEAVIMNYVFKNITGPSPSSLQGTFIRALAKELAPSEYAAIEDVGTVRHIDEFKGVLKGLT